MELALCEEYGRYARPSVYNIPDAALSSALLGRFLEDSPFETGSRRLNRAIHVFLLAASRPLGPALRRLGIAKGAGMI